MASLLSHLSSQQKKELFANLNYLNIKEYQSFCKKHEIPFIIHTVTKNGLRKTGDADRKRFVLGRIKTYLNSGKPQKPTVFKNNVVCDEPLTQFTPSTRMHYGQYDKKNPKLIKTLQQLTKGQFKNGMIARLVLRDFWLDGIAPTLNQFARAWIKESQANTKRHPEAAYLFDVAQGKADKNWKKLRIQKAQAALKILDQL